MAQATRPFPLDRDPSDRAVLSGTCPVGPAGCCLPRLDQHRVAPLPIDCFLPLPSCGRWGFGHPLREQARDAGVR